MSRLSDRTTPSSSTVNGLEATRYRVVRRKGLTLTEVILAAAIMVIVLFAGLQILLRAQVDNDLAQKRSIAMKSCQDVMEQLLAMSFSTMMVQDGIKFSAPKVSNVPNIGSISVKYVTPDNNVAEVTVRIAWEKIDVVIVTRRCKL